LFAFLPLSISTTWNDFKFKIPQFKEHFHRFQAVTWPKLYSLLPPYIDFLVLFHFSTAYMCVRIFAQNRPSLKTHKFPPTIFSCYCSPQKTQVYQHFRKSTADKNLLFKFYLIALRFSLLFGVNKKGTPKKDGGISTERDAWEINIGGYRKYYFEDDNLGLLFNLSTQTVAAKEWKNFTSLDGTAEKEKLGKVQHQQDKSRTRGPGRRASLMGRQMDRRTQSRNDGQPVTCSHRQILHENSWV